MDTIIQRNTTNPLIYHGIVTAKYGDYFIFYTRSNGKNIVFEGGFDFWQLIEGLE